MIDLFSRIGRKKQKVKSITQNTTFNLGTQVIHCRLVRTNRRTLVIQVIHQEIVVRAPLCVPDSFILQSLNCKRTWITKQLQLSEVSTSYDTFIDGQGSITYLGKPLSVQLIKVEPAKEARKVLLNRDLIRGCVLEVYIGEDFDTKAVLALIVDWLEGQARDIFKSRLDYFAEKMQVNWHNMRISRAKTRWGSAHQNGTIGLNLALLQCHLEVIDYVVVHELAHLRYMNHQAQFWQLVESTLPNYQTLRKQLKNHKASWWLYG
ncbi:MAG: SprT family zinc-dependent metalloprotease [Gammaproteobacteria bacterium]|nr:SprT family zinc-dependent metalloprotease [Gammaproteobacteria bacterium]